MRFSTLFMSAGIAQQALGAVIQVPEGKRAVAFGYPTPKWNTSRNVIVRRGEEYSMDRLDELEEEASDASKDDIYHSIDYLVNIYNQNNVQYGLMGGIALQLYGYEDRSTVDSDMVVSVNSRDLLNLVVNDDNIARPPPLMAASGTVRLFINIDDQQVESDVFVAGGDQSPPLDTEEMNGYQVLKLAPLIASKLKRAEENDNQDVLWLIENKGNDVKDIADNLDKDARIQFALYWQEEDDDKVETILEAFKLSEDDIDD